MKLSIIILSWNDRRLVTQAVQSILDHVHGIEYELIVIDNASQDDSVAALRQFGARITLIANPTNRGFAAGNNQGWQIARGEYVWLLNQDVIVPPHTVETMANWLDHHSKYGAVTVTLKNPDDTIQYYMHRRFPTLWSLPLALIHKRWPRFCPAVVRRYLYLDQDFQHDFDIEQAAGSCLMLRRCAIEQLGYLFDEQHFPLYYNDVDLCYRLWAQPWPIRCLTNVALIHYKGTSVRRIPRWRTLVIYLKAVVYYFIYLRRGSKSSGVK